MRVLVTGAAGMLGRDLVEHLSPRHDVTAVDLDTKRVSRELQAWQWCGGDLVAHETHDLIVNVYSSTEIVAALSAAGFVDVRVVGGYHGGPPTGSERFLVYLAHSPPAPH